MVPQLHLNQLQRIASITVDYIPQPDAARNAQETVGRGQTRRSPGTSFAARRREPLGVPNTPERVPESSRWSKSAKTTGNGENQSAPRRGNAIKLSTRSTRQPREQNRLLTLPPKL